MRNRYDIRELVEAVRRNPGSPAYAQLVEHYIDKKQLDEAIRLGREGFNNNPGFERGAVVYLRALRRGRKAERAAEVFGRAVAYLPRSAKIRLEWALVLAESGRDEEARRFAKEALDLDPLNREARALVATLGQPGGPSHSDNARIDLAPKVTHTPEPEPPRPSLASQARARRAAAIRPRRTATGEPKAPHSLFDLTPGPAMADSLRAQGELPPLPQSPFDITPMPEPADGPGDADSANRRIVPEPAPPASTERGQQPEQQPEQQPGPPPTPSPDGQSSSDSPLPAPPARRSRRGRGIWIAMGLVVLAGLGVGGFVIYRQLQQRRLDQQVDQAVARLTGDRVDDLEAAAAALSAVTREHPDNRRAAAALALVCAHKGARLGLDPSLAARTKQLLQGGGFEGRARAWAAAAGQLLDCRDTAGVKATEQDMAQLRLAQMLCAPPAEKIELAAALPKNPTPALAELAAQVLRLQGKVAAAQALVDAALARHANHGGLLIQRALLALARGEPPKSLVQSLQPHARRGPLARARITLIESQLAARRGELDQARAHARQGAKLAPDDPELVVTLGRLLLIPGGDRSEALPLLRKQVPTLAAYAPLARRWLARALLLSAQPQAAQKVLDELPAGGGKDPAQELVAALRVWSASARDDSPALKRLCATPRDAGAGLYCIHSLTRRAETARAARLVRKLARRPDRQLARAMIAVARGDANRAARLLRRFKAAATSTPGLARILRGQVLAKTGEAAAAETVLRQAVTEDAKSVRSLLALADVLIQSGHDSEARTLLDDVLAANPTQATVLARAGQAFLAAGLANKAAQLLARGASGEGQRPLALTLLEGRVALANNQADRARELFARVVQRDPKQAEALVELGRIAMQAKQTAKAQRLFSRALALRPDDPALRLLLARVHAATGDYHKALSHGMDALRALKASGQGHKIQETLILLGRLFRGGDRWAKDRAEELLYEGVKGSSPLASTAYLELGRLHRQRGERARALVALRNAVKAAPTNAEAHLELGRTLMRSPRGRRLAKRSLQRYLELRPRGEQADHVRALLKRLH